MKRLAITALILCFLFISCEAGKTQSGISGDLENRLEEPEDENRAPDFRLIDTKGELVDLASFKDKKSLILLFWTTWCPYCRRAMRDLNQEYAQLESLDIEVLAINIMERASRIKLFLSSFPVKFKILLDRDGRVADSYHLVGVPTYVLIDKRGRVRFNKNYFPKSDYQRLLLEE